MGFVFCFSFSCCIVRCFYPFSKQFQCVLSHLVLSHPVILRLVPSCHTPSCPVPCSHVASCPVPFSHVPSWPAPFPHVTPCPIPPSHVPSCPVPFSHVPSWPAPSPQVTPCPIPPSYVPSCSVSSRHTPSGPVLSHRCAHNDTTTIDRSLLPLSSPLCSREKIDKSTRHTDPLPADRITPFFLTRSVISSPGTKKWFCCFLYGEARSLCQLKDH